MQSLAGGGQRPISDYVEFRFRWSAAVTCQIVTDIFHAVLEEVTFTHLQREPVLLANNKNAFQVVEQIEQADGEEQDVVNDDTVASIFSVGVLGLEEGIPFGGQDMHHASIKARRVARAKRHDAEAVLHIVGRKESELVLIAVADSDLMVSAASIEADEVQFTSRVAEVVNSVFASGNRVFERKSDTVEFTV